MSDYMDFFSIYVMGSVQILMGFYFLTRYIKKKVKYLYFVLFTAAGFVIIRGIPSGSIIEFLVYVFMLIAGGIFICHGDRESVILYAALTAEIMQLSFGVINSLLTILYPCLLSFDHKRVGILLMILGNVASCFLAVFCYWLVWRYFSFYDTIKKKYLLIILTPIVMIFFMEQYISSVIYGNLNIADENGVTWYKNHVQLLIIQFLAMVSLFCIMFAYKKLLENFHLSTELSLLEQQEHSLNQYVEEVKARYEKTRSFRHDIKNHISVVKELLRRGKLEQALHYIGDMESMTVQFSFPCSTNNPVVDMLVGNKLGIAVSLGIDVHCSLILPYPCLVRDIDFCVILSNALDNAIHACQNMHHGEKYLRVTGRIQGDFILLEVENSFQGENLSRRGTGLSNIKTVAEKYHGAMSIKTEGAIFLLSVLLIIPQQSENSSQQNHSFHGGGSRRR